MRAFIEEDGKRVLYQEGPLAKMRTPADLIGRYAGGAKLLPEGTLMTCGTVAAIGGVRPSTTFAMELEDSVAGRTLRHEYRSGVLPVVA